jgi:hypothetical protein
MFTGAVLNSQYQLTVSCVSKNIVAPPDANPSFFATDRCERIQEKLSKAALFRL